MTQQPRPLSVVIDEMGEDFAIDAMEDFDDRLKSGEFLNKTAEEIRAIYRKEAIEREEDEALQAQQDALED